MKAQVISLDVLFQGKKGFYSLTVFVNSYMSMATGRESRGMPEKMGEIFIVGNGKHMFGVGQRRGAEVCIETVTQPSSAMESVPGTFYEIKTGLRASAGLVEFESTQKFLLLQDGDLQQTKLLLRGTPDDPMDTIPIEEITSASYSGYESATRLVREVELDKSFDFRPYIYGKFYDNWPATCKRQKI